MKHLIKVALVLTSALFIASTFFACTGDLPTESAFSTATGSISGKALYSNSGNHAGIMVTLEKTDGMRSVAVERSVLTGAVVSNARMVAGSSTVGSDGSYSFNNLADGVYTVYASSNSSLERAVYVNAVVSGGKSVTVQDLNLTATGTISGTITIDGNETGNEGMFVFIAGTSFMAVTDTAGNFNMTGVPAGSNYQIIISKGNFTYSISQLYSVQAAEATLLPDLSFTSAEINGRTPVDGKDGTSMKWLGSFSSSTMISNPQYLNAYFNTTDGSSYIYDGEEWTLLASKGDTGATGAQGEKGDKGDTGATGAQGEKGDKGDTGATGAQGEKGDKGDTGATGAQGEKGDKGDTGATGAQGEKGEKGDTGATGAQGEKGDKGDTGATGAQGEKGDKGDKGDTGATGAQGEKGEKGDTGATGAQGEKGDKGDTGATGAQGEKGDKGDKGDTGAQGEQGIQGEKGEKGDTGATGAQGEKGDKGDTGATGAQGEKGDKGDKGDTGATGAQGEKGDKGDTGATGAQGEAGPVGGITYSVTTRNPTNQNVIITATVHLENIARVAYYKIADTTTGTMRGGEVILANPASVTVDASQDGSYKITADTNGTYYIAVMTEVGSCASTMVTITNIDKTAPASVSNLKALYDRAAGKIIVSWTAPADADLDRVTLSYTKGGSTVSAEDTVTGNSYQLTGIESDGDEYIFTLKAYDKAGNASTPTTTSVIVYAVNVGDIFMDDGSVMTLAEYEAYAGSAKAVGVYAGMKNQNGVPLGLGIINSFGGTNSGYKIWAPSGTTGYNTKFDGIICTPSATGEGAASTATFTGDTDGSDNWAYICSVDPTGTADAATNYPAFHYANTYGSTAGLTGEYEEGWYMPSLAELCTIYKNKSTINKTLSKITGAIQLRSYYLSSSQSSNYYGTYTDCYGFAWYVVLYDGYVNYVDSKRYDKYVCCLRAFN